MSKAYTIGGNIATINSEALIKPQYIEPYVVIGLYNINQSDVPAIVDGFTFQNNISGKSLLFYSDTSSFDESFHNDIITSAANNEQIHINVDKLTACDYITSAQLQSGTSTIDGIYTVKTDLSGRKYMTEPHANVFGAYLLPASAYTGNKSIYVFLTNAEDVYTPDTVYPDVDFTIGSYNDIGMDVLLSKSTHYTGAYNLTHVRSANNITFDGSDLFGNDTVNVGNIAQIENCNITDVAPWWPHVETVKNSTLKLGELSITATFGEIQFSNIKDTGHISANTIKQSIVTSRVTAVSADHVHFHNYMDPPPAFEIIPNSVSAAYLTNCVFYGPHAQFNSYTTMYLNRLSAVIVDQNIHDSVIQLSGYYTDPDNYNDPNGEMYLIHNNRDVLASNTLRVFSKTVNTDNVQLVEHNFTSASPTEDTTFTMPMSSFNTNMICNFKLKPHDLYTYFNVTFSGENYTTTAEILSLEYHSSISTYSATQNYTLPMRITLSADGHTQYDDLKDLYLFAYDKNNTYRAGKLARIGSANGCIYYDFE